MGIIVIVAYRPKEGKVSMLQQLMREHYPTLLQEGLVTERLPVLMQAKDGTIVEVFEWKSQEAISQAHTNAAVLKMWGQYAEACDIVPLTKVAETADMFAAFAAFE